MHIRRLSVEYLKCAIPAHIDARPNALAITSFSIQADGSGIVLPIPENVPATLWLCAHNSNISRHCTQLHHNRNNFRFHTLPPPPPTTSDGRSSNLSPLSPIKPASLLLIHLPPPPPTQRQLALNGINPITHAGEDDKEDDDDDCDDDVSLDHGCDAACEYLEVIMALIFKR